MQALLNVVSKMFFLPFYLFTLLLLKDDGKSKSIFDYTAQGSRV